MDGQVSEPGVDHYAILGVARGASVEEVEAAYRRQARRWHPDVNAAPDAATQMRRLNLARDALSRRRHCAADVSLPPDPPAAKAEPPTVHFGAMRAICRHPPMTVRLLNTGGPVASVRLEPEDGPFWSIGEVRGGETEFEIAQLDFDARVGGLPPGPHRDLVQLFLDDDVSEVELTVVVEPQAHPAVALWTATVVGLLTATGVVTLAGGTPGARLVLATLTLAAVLAAGALAGHSAGWPANWSTVRPVVVWFDRRWSAPMRLRHHLPSPQELLPASRAWTSATVDRYASTVGVGTVRAVFSARRFQSYAGHRPRRASRVRVGPVGYVYVPPGIRMTRGGVERTVAHQIGHLAWPPFRHDPDFFSQVQRLIDAAPCPTCGERLRQDVACN